jgi:hypothetical protein
MTAGAYALSPGGFMLPAKPRLRIPGFDFRRFLRPLKLEGQFQPRQPIQFADDRPGEIAGISNPTLTYITQVTDGVDRTIYTFAMGTLAAGNYVCAVSGSGTGNQNISSVTVGGVAITQVHNFIGTDTRGRLGTVAIPGGATDIVLTFAGAMARAGGALWRLEGTTSLTPFSAPAIDTTATSNALSVALDIPANGCALGYTGNNQSTLRTVTWTGLTEDFDEELPTGRNHSGAHSNAMSVETGRTITAQYSSTVTTPFLMAASWS